MGDYALHKASHLATLGFRYEHTMLWSSSCLLSEDGKRKLEQCHMDYIQAGAQVLGTCTYQLSATGLKGDGINERELPSLFHLAIDILANAIENRPHKISTKPQVALSLGPYAIALANGAEYTGVYPSPYGDGPNPSQELVEFHLSRLTAVASSPRHWAKVDVILFETIPLILEVYAIRQAVAQLYRLFGGMLPKKELWISFVFPEGRLPGWPTSISSQKGLEQITDATFHDDHHNSQLAEVSAIGINCTKPKYLLSLLDSIFLLPTSSLSSHTLLLYPDGGKTWDPITRSWDGEEGGSDCIDWSLVVGKAVRCSLERHPSWSLVVGGCCETGPQHIEHLRRIIQM